MIFFIIYTKFKKMKKILIAALAAAGVVTYLLSRKKAPAPVNNTIVEQTHHITKVFSKAKQHAINH